MAFPADYVFNPYADWKITVRSVQAPEGKRKSTLRLWQDEWLISTPDWWNIADNGAIEIAGDRRISLWIAAPRNTIWRLEAIDPDGAVIPDAILQWSAELMPMFE